MIFVEEVVCILDVIYVDMLFFGSEYGVVEDFILVVKKVVENEVCFDEVI